MKLHAGRIAGAVLAVVILFTLLLAFACTFIVREDEQVVVTQFGKPVRVVKEPGLKFKKPFIQEVNRFEKRLIAWDGEPERMPTRDKKMIFIDTWARWRVADLERFFTACGTIETGQGKLDGLVDSAVRDVVGSHNLIEVVRSTNREMVYEAEDDIQEERPSQRKIAVGREKMAQAIKDRAVKKLADKYGIGLVDVRIKRINYVESVREAVYGRMKAERDRIASRYRSEAQEQREIILGDMAKELAVIEGDGDEKSKRIRGEADAEAIKIYGEALSKNPEFYTFLRALEAYKVSFGKETEIILTTDSPFLKFLEQELDVPAKAPKKQRGRP